MQYFAVILYLLYVSCVESLSICLPLYRVKVIQTMFKNLLPNRCLISILRILVWKIADIASETVLRSRCWEGHTEDDFWSTQPSSATCTT